MKKYSLFCLIILTIISRLYAQDEYVNTYGNVIPPSPTAFEFTKFGQIPVGTFTGTPNITIPIYTIKEGDISMPIYLSYNSNGVKVDQISSWVGMGWSLIAGGTITRIIRDEPDEAGYRVDTDKMDSIDMLDWSYILTHNDQVDTEPDLYIYNFNGFSGKFVIDAVGHPRLIPYDAITILMEDDGITDKKFTIITKDGYKYYFGANDNSRERSGAKNSCSDGGLQNFMVGKVTAWYLTKVKSPSGREINFTYHEGSINYFSGLSETTTKVSQDELITCNSCNELEVYQNRCFNEISLNSRHISKITSTNFEISFEVDNNRPDLNPTSLIPINLKSITIKDRNTGKVFKKVTFEKIFSNNYGFQINQGYSVSNDGMHHRMFLSKVISTAGQKEQPPYIISYYDINALPSRLSLAQDHWGYFNGRPNTSFTPVPNGYDHIFGSNNVDREPNMNAVYGLIKEIKYPTGGKTAFEYEMNTFWDGDKNVETGGLRIKKILDYLSENDQSPKVKKYFYSYLYDLNKSSGIVPETPYYLNKTYLEKKSNECDDQNFENGSNNYYIIRCTGYTLSSSSNTNLYNISGSHIAYKSVLIGYGDNFENGGEYFIYNSRRDEPGNVINIGEFSNVRIPGATTSNFGWNTGTLLEKGTIKKDSNGNFVVLYKAKYKHNYDQAVGNDERKSYTIVAAVIRKLYEPLGGEENYYRICSDTSSRIFIGWECISNHNHWLYNALGYRRGYCINPFVSSGIINPKDQNKKIYYYGQCYNKNIGDTVYLSRNIEHYDLMVYKIYSYWGYLMEEKTFTYDTNGQNPIINTTEYEYGDHGLLSKKTFTKSNGDKITTEFHYPLDYDPNAANVKELIDSGFVGLNIDTRTLLDNKLIRAKLIKYSDNGLPIETYNAEAELGYNLPFDSITPYSYGVRKYEFVYNDSNSLITVKPSDNLSTSYIWSYNHTYPVVKGENIDHTTLQNAVNAAMDSVSGYSNLDELTNAAIGKMNGGTGNMRSAWNDFNVALRSQPSLSNAMITTYTYDPLVGMTSLTDPAGITTYYTYDAFGRLKQTEDGNQHVQQRYAYNYKTVPELSVLNNSLSFSDATDSKSTTVNSNIKWSVTDNRPWITVSPLSGDGEGQITITVEANGSTSSRSGTVTVSDAGGHGLPAQTISITQQGVTPYLNLSKNYVQFYNVNEFDIVDVTSNVSWTWTVDYYTGYYWLMVQKINVSGNDASLKIIATDAPPFGEQWHAEIEVTGGGITKYISVYISSY